MKTKLFVIALFFLPVFAFAQTDAADTDGAHNQIGVNATRLIKELFSFNNTTTSVTSPYILTYKYITGNTALRMGIGGTNSKSKTNPNNGQPLSSSMAQSVNFRVGCEFRKSLSAHWLCYYGVDGVYNYNVNRFKSQTTPSGFPPQSKDITSNIENYSFGAGGVLGFEFKLAKRVSFNVETQAYYVYGENRMQEKNTQFTGSNTSSYTAFNSFQIVLPTALFFVVSL
jgi:hypothetical protein